MIAAMIGGWEILLLLFVFPLMLAFFAFWVWMLIDCIRSKALGEPCGTAAVTIDQLTKQLYKLVNILTVLDITDIPSVERELMLLKVNANSNSRSEILELAGIFRARVVDVAEDALTLEIVGDPGKIVAVIQVLEKFGIREIARTGKVALTRESKVNTEYLKL